MKNGKCHGINEVPKCIDKWCCKWRNKRGFVFKWNFELKDHAFDMSYTLNLLYCYYAWLLPFFEEKLLLSHSTAVVFMVESPSTAAKSYHIEWEKSIFNYPKTKNRLTIQFWITLDQKLHKKHIMIWFLNNPWAKLRINSSSVNALLIDLWKSSSICCLPFSTTS